MVLVEKTPADAVKAMAARAANIGGTLPERRDRCDRVEEMLAFLLMLAHAAPGRTSAVLPGLEPVERGHGHVGFVGTATWIGGGSGVLGVSGGVAATRRTFLSGMVVQAPDRAFLAAGMVAVRQTVVDNERVGLGFYAAFAGFRDFDGRRGLVLDASFGVAFRYGERRRFVDVSLLPASLLIVREEGAGFGAPFVFPTPFVVSFGWNRQVSDAVRLRTGFPEGLGLHWASDAMYVDVSAMVPGFPLWGNAEIGVRF
jgi:hypothetical protein